MFTTSWRQFLRSSLLGRGCLIVLLMGYGVTLTPLAWAQDFSDDPYESDTDIGVIGRQNFNPQGKFDISAYGGLNTLNVLTTDSMLGGSLRFNVLDWLGIEGRYMHHFFDMSSTGLEAEAAALATAKSSFFVDFIRSEILGHVVFSPFYGKHHLWGTAFVNYQLYVFAGGGLMLLDQVVIVPSPNTSTYGVSFGGGFKFYLNHFLHLTLEIRDLIYSDKSFNDNQFSSQLAIQLAIGVTLPTFDQPKRKI